MKAFWRNAALLAVSLLPFSSANAVALQAKQYGDFDRYVLALSWQTGFCQSQHDRNRNERDECRLQTETTNKADFLTVHGLWPGLPKSVAARGVDERRWMRFGCNPESTRSARQPNVFIAGNRVITGNGR